MTKETDKKHEGFATKTGREKFFFFEKKCLATKKRRVTMRRVEKEREGTSGGYIQRSGNMKESTDRKRNEKH